MMMLKSKGLTKQPTRSRMLSKQGQLLKNFKDTEHFFDYVGQSISKIYLKFLLYKFLKKYRLLKKYTLPSSYFLKNQDYQGFLQRKHNFFCIGN